MKSDAGYPTTAPRVPCPRKLPSPFSTVAQIFSNNRSHYQLEKVLYEIDALIDQKNVEELEKINSVLQRTVESEKYQGNIEISESHFQFTVRKQNYGYGQDDLAFTRYSVPFLGKLTSEDIAVFSTITGKDANDIPLRTALALLHPRFDWNFSLAQIRQLGEPIPSIPETIVKFPGLHIAEERRLILRVGNGNEPIELGPNWRQRGQPICDAVQEPSDDALWPKPTVDADIVRSGDKFIWLPMQPPTKGALLCPGLIQLKDYTSEIAECLKLWQAKRQKPEQASERLKCWMDSKANAAPLVANIAEIILSAFAPWPEPYDFRPDSDPAWGWSPEQCLKQVMPLFRAISKAPLRGNPPNLVKTFLSLIRRPNFDAHAYAGEFMQMWKFSVRTNDHSWINGEIVGEPHNLLGSSTPLKFEAIEESYSTDSEGYCVSCSGIDCFISEERNPRH